MYQEPPHPGLLPLVGEKETHFQKRRVYLNEYNVLMDRTAYLPLVSGILQAYALTSSAIAANYQFMPFLFYRDDIEKIVDQHQDPAVAAFSVSMWNEQLSLEAARALKAKYPGCLIVLGGPQVPHQAEEYFTMHPFIDVAVRGEGEEAFLEVLTRFLQTRDFSGIGGISFRDPVTKRCVRNSGERIGPRDIDRYPSPYLEGLFDPLLRERKDLEFQAIIETNRGCPFPCTYCYWGQGGLSRKYRFYSLERIRSVIAWCGQNKIRYVFNADSNFGMHSRDYEIAEFLVEAKRKYGYPDKFRSCFGKNTDERIYQIAKLLHQHEIEKGITLSFQSTDPQTLKNVRRRNIHLSTYKNLQVRFNADDVPVYSELILGLPGETYESLVNGIEDILQSGIKNQLFVYMCQVYPNTEMATQAYKKKFGIRTICLPLNEVHGRIRGTREIAEREEIIVSTTTMPVADWKRMAILSWVMQVFHSLKLAFFVMVYLHDRCGVKHTDFLRYVAEKKMSAADVPMLHAEIVQFENQLEGMLKGQGRGRVLPEYGAIYWDEEEASFLRISENLPAFYQEMQHVLRAFLTSKGIVWSAEELAEVVEYQRLRIPTQSGTLTPPPKLFQYNFPEYFQNCFKANPMLLEKSPQVLVLDNPKDYKGDRPCYARETILWGRKSGTMLRKVRWTSAAVAGGIATRIGTQ